MSRDKFSRGSEVGSQWTLLEAGGFRADSKRTLKYLSSYTNTHIIILWSDSLSSIQAISSLSARSRTTRDYMMLGRHFTVTTPGSDNTEYRDLLQNTIDNITSETITCYTDGSRTDSGTGAGYIITTNNNNTTLEERSFGLPDYCTVYQTELTAIIEACKYLSSYTNTYIIIWSDSLSSIQAISSLSTRSRTTRDCYDSLNALGSTNTLEIRWIAVHIGLWGNEKADELAKQGTTSESSNMNRQKTDLWKRTAD